MKRSPRLERYALLVGEDKLARVYHAGEPLVGVQIVHINTTHHVGDTQGIA